MQMFGIADCPMRHRGLLAPDAPPNGHRGRRHDGSMHTCRSMCLARLAKRQADSGPANNKANPEPWVRLGGSSHSDMDDGLAFRSAARFRKGHRYKIPCRIRGTKCSWNDLTLSPLASSVPILTALARVHRRNQTPSIARLTRPSAESIQASANHETPSQKGRNLKARPGTA